MKKSRSHNHKPVNEQNLLIATILNLVITLVEFAGGLLANSLALISDALHNLSDTFSIFIAFLANRVSKRNANISKTFGYKRIEILAALLNAVILIVICVFLFIEAWKRINDPEPVKSLIVIIVAMIGLVANILAIALLRNDSKKSINVKAAYVHLIGDSLSSIVVIIAAVAMQLFNIFWIDPVITILIGIYLIRESYIILQEAVNILMQSAPDNIDLKKIQSKVEAFPEISNLHHVHAWCLNDREIHLEAHIELLEDLKISDVKTIQAKVEKMLNERFRITNPPRKF